jgi:hypothetical protein
MRLPAEKFPLTPKLDRSVFAHPFFRGLPEAIISPDQPAG